MKKILAALILCICAITALFSCGGDSEPKITVVFHANGEVFKTMEFAEGERVYTPDAKPTKEGFVFNGWYYDEGIWQSPFDPTDLNNEFRAATHKLYARFEHLSFSLNDDGKGYTVKGALSGLEDTLVIPTKYLGKPVTAIAASAFADNTSITSITIPDSVTDIGQYAFARCTALTAVKLPNSTGLRVGNGAFSGCTSLESVNLGATLKEIPGYGFEGCTALMSVTVYQAEVVCGSAFRGCTALAEITLPDSVKKINLRAFEGCIALKTVNLSANVEEIGDYAFSGCTALTEIAFKGTSGVRSLGASALGGTALTELSLPLLSRLGEDALTPSLQSFRFGNKNLLYIDARAFASLSSDATVIYGSTLAEFEEALKDETWSEGRVVTITCDDGEIAP